MPDLLIPTRPSLSEPEVKLGWWHGPTDWLCYWLMTYQGINNRLRDLERPCSDIANKVAVLEWWQTDPLGVKVFQRVLAHSPDEIDQHLLTQWAHEAGLWRDEVSEILSHRLLGLNLFVGRVEPILFSITQRQFGNGRHRVYAAYRCKVPRLWVWTYL